MGRRNFNDGQEIVLEDLNAVTKAIERQLYQRVVYEMLQRTTDAFFDDSLLVSYSSSTSVLVKKGLGLQLDSSQSSPESTVRPIVLAADQSLSIETPDASNPRIDLVCVKADVADEITAARKYKDPSTSTITTEDLVVQKDWEADLVVVEGTPAATPSAPAVPAGYIKIAELTVTAVTGLSGSGAVTDSRTKMPAGALATIDTTSYSRLTAGATTTVTQLFADADALFKNGNFEYLDTENLGATPAAPGASKVRVYFKGGVPYYRPNGGSETPMAGSGGGGAGANWLPVIGNGALEDIENDEKVFLFEDGQEQEISIFFKVPNGYIAGRQITLRAGFYSPGADGDASVIEVTSYLVKAGTDAITSVANSNSETATLTNDATANKLQNGSFALTSSGGQINSLAVSAGDLIKIKMKRLATSDAADTDAESLRMIPSTTEIS